ncbi:energy-coupling factor transporter ATPase [Aliibacillus thermotolerans]|uniref:Energy-coupling factor transporter ATP-binding protein EcfA2 n=1 Tax=Aliibacillus thermotolerans TaxID=1834418 RepID=A0ABW0U944_9BACI|nr:energy-coupling factor transporter ATPase [Aliibacillus thermotolerans]MDA3128947.1 energy-coupling factor transporter ATPase [Aliibacillus thermotolerans]
MKIEFRKTNHIYMKKTPFETHALRQVSTTFPSGSTTAIIGQTGSGKSTLVQHINGLLKPDAGQVIVGGEIIDRKAKRKQLKTLRQKVGMVFQYPEHQLFEDTVEKELLFGPLNFGLSKKRLLKELPDRLAQVGLDETILSRSPFELSGGQMRRVAILSVLLMKPKVLILDEPTAGLDPKGQEEMIKLFKGWQQEEKATMILITHEMDEALQLAERLVVMDKGKIVMEGMMTEIFAKTEELAQFGLDIPESVRLLKQIEEKFQVTFSSYQLTPAQAAKEWVKERNRKGLTPHV